jgi:tRNA-dihydrouridine synthase B
MRLGLVTIDPPVFLAPMAGITNSPYRRLCRSLGCPVVITEMVSAEGIVRGGLGSLELLQFDPSEHPILVQLFGHDPQVVAEAAKRCAERGFDGVDINMGCPVKKIVKDGAGAALMRDPKASVRMLEAVRRALPKEMPVSVKLRAGWSLQQVNVVEVATRLAEAGADALTIHPRTRNQFYAGCADWNLITQVVRAVSVPVIGNGDLRRPEDATRMISQTGCAGVMVGRAAMGDPWIAGAMASALTRVTALPSTYPPSAQERLRCFSLHLDLMIHWLQSERRAVLQMRKHLIWYSRGLRGAAKLRSGLALMNTASDLKQALRQVLFEGMDRSHPTTDGIEERANDDSRPN